MSAYMNRLIEIAESHGIYHPVNNVFAVSPWEFGQDEQEVRQLLADMNESSYDDCE